MSEQFKSQFEGLKLKDVPQIDWGIDVEITPDNLEQQIEIPLIEPVKRCLELGIHTMWSNANGVNYLKARLTLDFYDLTDTNKQIAIKIFGQKATEKGYIDITMPTTQETKVPDIEQYFLSVINLFESQKPQE